MNNYVVTYYRRAACVVWNFLCRQQRARIVSKKLTGAAWAPPSPSLYLSTTVTWKRSEIMGAKLHTFWTLALQFSELSVTLPETLLLGKKPRAWLDKRLPGPQNILTNRKHLPFLEIQPTPLVQPCTHSILAEFSLCQHRKTALYITHR
jgi:hypothetical protein